MIIFEIKIYIMKKILFLFILIPVISYSQYSKKELRNLKKMKLKIVNRGLDLSATFVPYSTVVSEFNDNLSSDIEANWGEAMFALGLDVGDYYEKKQSKDGNNREVTLLSSVIFKGRYVFNAKYNGIIIIKDLNNNSKTVATIKYSGVVSYDKFDDNSYKRDYVISELIKSNK